MTFVRNDLVFGSDEKIEARIRMTRIAASPETDPRHPNPRLYHTIEKLPTE